MPNITKYIPDVPSSVALQPAWIEVRDKLLTGSKQVVVKDQDSFNVAEVALKQITGHSNELEKQRKAMTMPFTDAQKAIKKLADDAREELESEKARLKKEMGDYLTAQERLRQEAEQARLMAEAEAAQAAEEDPFGHHVKLEDTGLDMGGGPVQKLMSSVHKVRQFKITNPELVDRSLCSPDEKKIRQAIKDAGDIADIDFPGIEAWEENSVRSR